MIERLAIRMRRVTAEGMEWKRFNVRQEFLRYQEITPNNARRRYPYNTEVQHT